MPGIKSPHVRESLRDRVLSLVRRAPGLRAIDIRQRLQASDGCVCRILRDLKAEGMVQAQPHDEGRNMRGWYPCEVDHGQRDVAHD